MRIAESCSCGAETVVESQWSYDVKTTVEDFRLAHSACRTAERGVPPYTPTTPDPARLTLGEP
jgi:hypothetical protein